MFSTAALFIAACMSLCMQSSDGFDAMSACCCGQRSGNVIRFYSCGPGSRIFPLVCMLGPDWPCLLCTYGLILVPSLAFAVLMCVFVSSLL